MKTTFLFLMALAALFLACSTDQDLCPENACEPHGRCVVVNSQAQCNCEPPYEACEELTCCYTGRQMGEPCAEDEDCPLGFCLDYFFNEKYCTSTCESHDECIDHAVAESREMCCVEVETGARMCLKIAEGHTCGDGTGSCGDSCTGSLSSACAPGHPCLRRSDSDPMAICSSPCATDADCAVCEWSEDPEVSISCIPISGGEKYCLINDAEDSPDNTPCTTSRDCPENKTCSIVGIHTVCINVGALPPGSACNDEDDPNNLSYEERCRGLYCFNDMCSEVCVEDADCPEGMICRVLSFSNTDDEIYVCMGDKSCYGPAGCPEGESCQPILLGRELAGWCNKNEGWDPVGSSCDEDNDTCEVFCIDTLCTEWCSLNEDCPEDMRCGTIDFCLTEPCDVPENTAPATVCIGN
ncbi:MAG: hypothetical protein KAI66_16195 [Lentisphaeria bacterium]|nr:hypothetical protein [Lentisphaeria bacterium]